jgi:hypothetical protein
MLRFAGCALLISTANAQPAPDSNAPPSAAEPAAPSPIALGTALGTADGNTISTNSDSSVDARPAAALAAPGMTPAAPLPAPEIAPEIAPADYRWQVVAADVVSVVLAFSRSGTGIRLGGLTYVLGGPIIHAVHGQGARMGVSLALRVGLPIALALTGAGLAHHDCSPDDDDCDNGSLGGGILGFGVGIVTAMVVDSVVIAGAVKVRKHTGATWAPQIAMTPQHVGLGVVGRF